MDLTQRLGALGLTPAAPGCLVVHHLDQLVALTPAWGLLQHTDTHRSELSSSVEGQAHVLLRSYSTQQVCGKVGNHCGGRIVTMLTALAVSGSKSWGSCARCQESLSVTPLRLEVVCVLACVAATPAATLRP